jgi:hypothetical protein
MLGVAGTPTGDWHPAAPLNQGNPVLMRKQRKQTIEEALVAGVEALVVGIVVGVIIALVSASVTLVIAMF